MRDCRPHAVLIQESALVLETLTDLLGALGYRVTPLDSARGAQELAACPDALVLDADLLESGPSLCALLRRPEWRSVPVILLGDGPCPHELELRLHAHLPRPICLRELNRSLKQAMLRH
jgi:DNA-binding response OmpR family regulator